MRVVFNKLITKIKKEDYHLNDQIPMAYLLNLVCKKIIYRIYGFVRLRRMKSAFVSPSSVIISAGNLKYDNNLSIGRNVYIDALGQEGIKCGSNVSFGQNTTMIVTGSLTFLGKGILIGNNVGLGTHGYYGGAGGVRIGNDVIFGNYVSIHPENHNYDMEEVPIRLQGVNHKGIKIGNNCWIGAKATILDGAIIGDGCVVAAGAVVSGKFPDNVIIGGVPAKIIKSRFEKKSR